MTSSYMIQPASAMRQHIEMAPESGGVYALLLDTPDALEEALARASLKLDTVRLGSRPILYLGATEDSLRRRLKCHLSTDTCRSTFRMSLGALLAEELRLEARPIDGVSYFGFSPDSEHRLNAWIDAHVTVALRPASNALAEERVLIGSHDPLLNIAGRRLRPSAEAILVLRDRMRGLPFDRASLQ